MAEYRVVYVSDELLQGRDFALCHLHADGVTLCVNRRVRDLPDDENAKVWEDAWTAFRGMVYIEDIPEQRTHTLSR